MAKAKKKKKPKVRITPVRITPVRITPVRVVPRVKIRPKAGAMAAARERMARATLDAVERAVLTEKPPLPSLDPMEQAREAARLAQEGNLKLCRAVEVLREAAELAIMAEVDNSTGQPTTTKQLREILVTGLDEYSRLTHQSWRRNKIIHTRAGDRDLSPESFA